MLRQLRHALGARRHLPAQVLRLRQSAHQALQAHAGAWRDLRHVVAQTLGSTAAEGREMKTLLILKLLAGDPIHILVEPKICMVLEESFAAGHDVEIFDDAGAKEQIIGAECAEVQCLGEGCV
jgi:hypothetical protein